MATNPPSLLLKGIWLIHFVLSSWAMLSGGFIANMTYLYVHLAVLGIGLWAIIDGNSAEAVIMFIATLAISILQDIILLGIYEPRAHDVFEEGDNVSTSLRNEYRFSLGMCITNLILKPISIFLLFRIYQSRQDGSEFNSGIPGIGGSSGSRGGYDDLSGPPNTSSKEAYGDPAYQEPPRSGLP